MLFLCTFNWLLQLFRMHKPQLDGRLLDIAKGSKKIELFIARPNQNPQGKNFFVKKTDFLCLFCGGSALQRQSARSRLSGRQTLSE